MKKKMNLESNTYQNGSAGFEKKPLRVIIAGGGTGGHIFPAVAIANALKTKRPDIEILFVGAKGKMEMEKVPEAGYDIVGIDIAGYNRNSLIQNISLPYKLVKSFLKVRRIMQSFKPDVVIGVGGYSTFPVIRLAQSKGIPSFILESNSLPGKSNILLGKKAAKIFVAYDGMEKYFSPDRLLYTGNPVRHIFSEKISKEAGLQNFGLEEGRKTVLVIGGSLGAKSINETIDANLDVFKKNNLQLIWQTGKSFAPHAARAEEERTNIWTNAFINRMELAYAAADVVVARAGAMTIAELCVVKKAAVFVPYPFAAEDHQVKNASSLVEKNAAVMVEDGAVKTALIPAILQLVNDDQRIKTMEQNIAALAIADADERIANEILNTLNK
jgi:UDP-N-acetylglucosamine--N-acetylmuramyl-(pentapeptide) pyrophosphoryl-undecaprenol N-acetylglucosamine transferase